MSRLHIQRSEEAILSDWLKKNSETFGDFEASELRNEYTSTELVFMMLPVARDVVDGLNRQRAAGESTLGKVDIPCGFRLADVARVTR